MEPGTQVDRHHAPLLLSCDPVLDELPGKDGWSSEDGAMLWSWVLSGNFTEKAGLELSFASWLEKSRSDVRSETE